MSTYNSKIVLGNGTVLMDLTGDTVDESHVLAGSTFHDKTGAPKEGSCTFDSDTSSDTAAASEILLGKTAHARGVQHTGTMPNNGAQVGAISEKAGKVVIKQGYHDGSGNVGIAEEEQAKLIPENIRQGIEILGVTGTMSGQEDVKAQSRNVSPSFAAQTITPEAGYNYLSSVVVAAIPVVYTDNAAGGKTVTIG